MAGKASDKPQDANGADEGDKANASPNKNPLTDSGRNISPKKSCKRMDGCDNMMSTGAVRDRVPSSGRRTGGSNSSRASSIGPITTKKTQRNSEASSPFGSIRSGSPIGKSTASATSSPYREPPSAGTASGSHDAHSHDNAASKSSRDPASSTGFDEMLNSVASNLIKQYNADQANFNVEELVESLGNRSSQAGGNTEEDKEERMRVKETQRMLRELTSDTDLMDQVMKAAANPEMAKELARQADTAWRNIEAVPGGFRALYQMHRNIQQPLWQAVTDSGQGNKVRSNRYREHEAPKPSQPLKVDPVPNPWMMPAAALAANHTVHSEYPMNAYSLGPLFQSALRSADRLYAAETAHRAPRVSSGLGSVDVVNTGHPCIGTPSQPAAAQSPSGTRSAAADAATTATAAAEPAAAAASNGRYARELKELADMGMNDRDRCLTALEASDGDLFQALGILQSLEELDHQESEKEH